MCDAEFFTKECDNLVHNNNLSQLSLEALVNKFNASVEKDGSIKFKDKSKAKWDNNSWNILRN